MNDENTINEIILSNEQKDVVKTVCDLKNTIVIAKAGCGKTTTAIETAKLFYQKHREKTLILTYNSLLKENTRKEIRQHKLQHFIEAHSYHAAAIRYFVSEHLKGDEVIYRACEIERPTRLSFGLVIIDECQDITPLYCKFIQHLLTQCVPETPGLIHKPVLLLLGDPFQQIFSFNKSSLDYMLNPKKYFGELIFYNQENPDFVNIHLNISYRISHEMAEFVNTNLSPLSLKHVIDTDLWEKWENIITEWWGTGIHANPDRPRDPQSFHRIHENMYTNFHLQKSIAILSRHFNDFLIEKVTLLALTMKDKSPLRKYLDKFSQKDNENWIVLYGDGVRDCNNNTYQKIKTGKNIVSTIHRYKGMENDLVVLIGFDNYKEQQITPLDKQGHISLFNLFYVASTRAKRRLILSGNLSEKYVTERQTKINLKTPKQSGCSVTKLINHIPFDMVLSVMGNSVSINLGQDLLNKHNDKISGCVPLQLNDKICLINGRTPVTFENMTAVIGIFIELLIQQKCGACIRGFYMDELKKKFLSENAATEILDVMEVFQNKPVELLSRENLIVWALAKFAYGDGLIPYWRQMNTSYLLKWVVEHEKFINQCLCNTKTMLASLLLMDPETDWETLAPHITFWEQIQFDANYEWWTKKYAPLITGEMDMVLSNGIIVEMKMTNDIQLDHALQVQLYKCMKILNMNKDGGNQGELKTVVMIPNMGQIHDIELVLPQRSNNVPACFDLIYRCARRKMLLDEGDVTELEVDYKQFINTNNCNETRKRKFESIKTIN